MKIHVTIYMKSGNKILIKCDSFKTSKLTDNESRSLTFENCKEIWTIDLNEVEAIIAKRKLF